MDDRLVTMQVSNDKVYKGHELEVACSCGTLLVKNGSSR